jgi:transposase-like protein
LSDAHFGRAAFISTEAVSLNRRNDPSAIGRIRKLIYTTNVIDSLHLRLRKIVKNCGHFPSDEATTKLLFLGFRNITKDWSMPPRT